jgi:serine/threonine-protein kinase
LEERLGSGAMGDVYRAVNTAVGRTVALKILRRGARNNEEIVERFLQEAKVAYLVRHPHVVEVLDVDRDADGVPFIVLEYLEGEDLAAHVEFVGGSLPIGDALDLVIPAVEAVGAAHVKGLVHRDIKPENVFLLRHKGELVPKVVDFGVSKVLDHAGFKKTMTGVVVGTPPYMSPEQIQRPLGVDARADVWAFGVLMYELVTGTLPFDGRTVAELFDNICRQPVPRLADSRVWCPAPLAEIIERCLAKSPADRFETCMELAEALVDVRTDLARGALSDGPPTSARERTATVTESKRALAGWGELDLPSKRPGPVRDSDPARVGSEQGDRDRVSDPRRASTGGGSGPDLGPARESGSPAATSPAAALPAATSLSPGAGRSRASHTGPDPAGLARSSLDPAGLGAAGLDASGLDALGLDGPGLDLVADARRRPSPYRRRQGISPVTEVIPEGAPSIVDVLVATGLMAVVMALVPRLDPAAAGASLPSPLPLEMLGVGVLGTLIFSAIAWGVFHGGRQRDSMGLRGAGLALGVLTLCIAVTVIVLGLPRLPIREAVEAYVPASARLAAGLAALGFSVFGFAHARDALGSTSPRLAVGALLAALSVGGLIAAIALVYGAIDALPF